MHAKIKQFQCLDSADLSFKEFEPADPDCFSVNVRLLVGPDDGPGEESFDLVVCNPRWVELQCEKEGFLLGLHLLIVSRFNVDHLMSTLRKVVESISGDDWQVVANRVAQIGSWEFSDYSPMPTSREQ